MPVQEGFKTNPTNVALSIGTFNHSNVLDIDLL